ncbi:SRPBCC family protein [Nocardia amamiensis]|uniref:SRPBCC family protein n=1 Tax=Nocardia amamiensis TaxID=404578 RepID=A0ABS0CR79_9NOCA|nr:SRPBCC family protein [Nocardia amamiensis]MBF6299125.1 SRPBCC family protein [Nocardia amamiensis]
MFLLASAEAIVRCSREKTFAYAADLENFAEWFPGVLSVVSHDELPFAESGKLYLETVAVPLRGRRQVLIRVAEATPSRRLVTEGELPLLQPRMEIEFLDAGPDACEVHWRMFSRNKRSLPRWTIFPIARRVMTMRARTALRNLRWRLEDDAARGVTEKK